MSEWSAISYREFWDVPRAVIARHGSKTFLFDSRFDELLDDYLDHYEVWRLPPLTQEQIDSSWIGLEAIALERLPNIGLRELPFEVSSRNTPDSDAARYK